MSDSDNTPFGFGRFVPGFDFLQNLAKGASSGVSAMPGLASWVAPTVSVEELDKRIGELKSVQFWLEQNARALAATVQALEVQKMTLATLKNMNVAMGDMATVFGSRMAEGATQQPQTEARREEKTAPTPEPTAQPAQDTPQNPFAQGAAGMVDPVQWWGALTHQFQQIAANAMRDVSQHAASAPVAGGEMARAAADMTSQFVNQSMKGAQEMTRQAMEGVAGKSESGKPAAKKTVAKKATAKKTAAPRPRNAT